MKNFWLVLVLLALIFLAPATLQAEGEDGPAVDLVQMFGNAPDITVQGIKLQTIMKAKFGKKRVMDVYNDIYYRGIEPNQIVCRSTWYFDENLSKAVPTVIWSVWYRPSAMVSRIGTSCVDTKVDKNFVDTWSKQGYRWLGSGVEPHMHLQWMNMWDSFQKKTDVKWCKAGEMSYWETRHDSWPWPVHKKAVFEHNAAIMANALVSRDITCTSDVKTYGKWMRTPGWGYVFINIK